MAKKYIIKSQLDNTVYCHKKTYYWGSLDDEGCILGNKQAVEEQFRSMNKIYISTKHPVITEVDVIIQSENQINDAIDSEEINCLCEEALKDSYSDKEFDELLNNSVHSEEIDAVLDNILSLKESIESLKKTAVDKLSASDKSISNIYHHIEFNVFNGADGYKLCRLLKKYLSARREAKNDLMLLDYIKVPLSNINTKTIETLKRNCYRMNNRRFKAEDIDLSDYK